MSKRIAVILSGCGNKDGTEITEAVSVILTLSERGANYQIFAPDQEFTVRDPFTNELTQEKRSVLKEAARIARGEIKPLTELRSNNFDGLVLPGGSGAAMNLSNWATHGAGATVNSDVARAIEEFSAEEKPIAAICIAPTLIARVLGRKGVTVTIGNNREVATEIEKTGAKHETCAVDDFITDRDHRIITTPAYMYGDAKPHQVHTGIQKAISELIEMS